MGVVAIFFTLFVWSSSFALSKVALEASAPLFATGSRMLVAGLVLSLYTFLKSPFKIRSSLRTWVGVLTLSFTGFYLANVFEFLGLQHISAAKASFIYGLSPFLAALFSYLQLKEKITPKKILGLALGIAGYITYLIFGGEGTYNALFGDFRLGTPELFLLSATCVSSFGWTLMRKIEKRSPEIPVAGLNAICMVFAGILSLVHSYFSENWTPLPVSDASSLVKSLISLIILSNFLCYNLYGRLLRKYSSTFLSFCGLVMPIFSGFYGFILLGEKISLGLFLAVCMTLVGCRMVYSEEFRQGYLAS
ncbi:DMT family transporter [Chlamydiifrater phoenicopteri]|uniref:DMT family transporter n=1 Tax=Chlamydiifrater phoenicopteri TaxID=2681469 RepID=UPI001BCFBA24|nr:DMT family transporter [Chlamydiifrater phoenicopteri]